MKKNLFILGIGVFLSINATASDEAKAKLGKQIADQCKNNYKLANNPDITEKIYTEFCDCMASEYQAKFSEKELEQVLNPNTIDGSLKMKMAETMEPCAADFSKNIIEHRSKK